MSTTLQVRGGACCTNIDLVGIVHALWLRNQSIATRWWLSILIRTELDPISPGRAKTWPIGDVQGLRGARCPRVRKPCRPGDNLQVVLRVASS